MFVRTAGLLVSVVALCAACSPGPGSAEWCKGVLQGNIKASVEEMTANSEKCEAALMKEVMG